MPMMAITTNSSTNVKPNFRGRAFMKAANLSAHQSHASTRGAVSSQVT